MTSQEYPSLPKKIPKRFLNVEYSGTRTRIDITDFDDLSEVQDALKVKLHHALSKVDAPQLQFYDQQDQQITDLDDIPEDYYKKLRDGGLVISIHISPPPIREPKATSFLSADEDFPRKRYRIEISDLTTQMKSFSNAQLVEGCIQSQNHDLLPYPQEKVKNLYARKCYQDVFDLLLENIHRGFESFAISGTPGIGKSLFFVYILYRLMDDFRRKTLSLKPNRVLYQMGSTFQCFDLQHQLVARTTKFDAETLVREQDTFYIIDGQKSEPLASSCVVLFISSPRSEWYKAFMKQKMAKEWYFPVWTMTEIQTCQSLCYPDLSIEMLQERHHIYGGVARFVFHKDDSIPVRTKMNSALSDTNAVRGIKYV